MKYKDILRLLEYHIHIQWNVFLILKLFTTRCILQGWWHWKLHSSIIRFLVFSMNDWIIMSFFSIKVYFNIEKSVFILQENWFCVKFWYFCRNLHVYPIQIIILHLVEYIPYFEMLLVQFHIKLFLRFAIVLFSMLIVINLYFNGNLIYTYYSQNNLTCFFLNRPKVEAGIIVLWRWNSQKIKKISLNLCTFFHKNIKDQWKNEGLKNSNNWRTIPNDSRLLTRLLRLNFVVFLC